MTLRKMLLELDEDDYRAVQAAIAHRQKMFRDIPGCERGIMPEGDSNTAGAVLAEICRGWLESLGR